MASQANNQLTEQMRQAIRQWAQRMLEKQREQTDVIVIDSDSDSGQVAPVEVQPGMLRDLELVLQQEQLKAARRKRGNNGQ